MYMKYLILFVSTLCELCGAARILGVIPSISFSHQVVFRPLWNELAKRGHELVVVTTDPQNDPSLNIREINIGFAYDLWNTKYNVINNTEKYRYNRFKLIKTIRNILFDIYNEELLHPEIQTILKNETEHFDLVVAEYLFPAVFAFSNRFNCPYIGITSLDLHNFFHSIIPTRPVSYKDILLPFDGNLNIWRRLASTLYGGDFNVLDFYRDKNVETKFIETHFGKNIPPVSDIIKNVGIVIINADATLNKGPLAPMPVPRSGEFTTEEYLHTEKDLPKDLQEYLDEANNGVIYFSLETDVKNGLIHLELRNTILEALNELPYKVLCKFNVTNFPNIPSNVKIVNWLPQLDILRHPNVKAFITQGDLQSMEQAIFSHVPLLGIPLIADQDGNVQKMVKKGFGLYLNKSTLTKESLKDAILEVVNNPKYKEKIERAELSKDESMTGIERAIWWMEHVIRHKKATQLRHSTVMDSPIYQYYVLDVIAILLEAIIFLFMVFRSDLKHIKLINRIIIMNTVSATILATYEKNFIIGILKQAILAIISPSIWYFIFPKCF